MEELGGLLLPLVFLAVLYLLLIRPQQKRRKEQESMVRRVAVGDDIVTISGLHGRVIALDDTTMDLTVDAQGENVLRFERGSLARIVSEPDEVDDVEDTDTDTDTDEDEA
ncbi:MAG: preprotein translocase subunit YajC [Nitriliruptoraceae bacterium]|nr:preprotein translocase subunit YajC [Nitriliruptoraceae bacterium]